MLLAESRLGPPPNCEGDVRSTRHASSSDATRPAQSTSSGHSGAESPVAFFATHHDSDYCNLSVMFAPKFCHYFIPPAVSFERRALRCSCSSRSSAVASAGAGPLSEKTRNHCTDAAAFTFRVVMSVSILKASLKFAGAILKLAPAIKPEAAFHPAQRSRASGCIRADRPGRCQPTDTSPRSNWLGVQPAYRELLLHALHEERLPAARSTHRGLFPRCIPLLCELPQSA